MKWLIALVLALSFVTPAFAGEDPYIAVIGNDAVCSGAYTQTSDCAKPWYISQKHQQFYYAQPLTGFDDLFPPECFGTFPPTNQFTRVGGAGCEMFRSQFPVNQREMCSTLTSTNRLINKNARVTAGNEGFYEWYIRLPKKPSTEINIVLQCGILKPNGSAFGTNAIFVCAAETGENLNIGGICARANTEPGENPLTPSALPMITAIAYPGPYAGFTTPFNLTAFRNPGTYEFTGALANDEATQVLDGTEGTRVVLKACMDKTIVVKLPVTGQENALTQVENDLEQGDLIYVRLDVPDDNTVDIYCHAQSARLAGVGENVE